MNKDGWMELTVLEKKKYNYLVEIQDITKQLGESLDRNDQVSAQMLVALRQDPVRLLAEVDDVEKTRLAELPEEEQQLIRAVWAGGEPRDEGQRFFQEQAGKTRRLLEQVVELDRRLSLRMAGDRSFYSK